MSAKIMIVDDSDLVAKLHSGILHKAGYECTIAENGAVALELLVAQDYGLIISDINMPRMNGYELVKRIRRTPGYEKAAVLMVSTEAKKGDIQKAMEAGANLYLVKPIAAEQLLTSVESLLKAS